MKTRALALALAGLCLTCVAVNAQYGNREGREERHERRRPASSPKPAAAPRRPTAQPRPVSRPSPQRRFSPLLSRPAYPAPQAAAPTAPRAPTVPLFRPIKDARHIIRDGRQAPAPQADGRGAAITATPVQRPPASHTTIVNDPKLVGGIMSLQRVEVQRDHYYWHDEGGRRYCHYFDVYGDHWYGFYLGPSFYWTRYYYRRWWWYDPVYERWVYYNGGYWWWQDPASPRVVYVYNNETYVPYDAAAPASSLAAPAGPQTPTYQSDVDAATYQAKERPQDFALVFGVENYASLPKADFAARDAKAMGTHLAALGYPARNTVVLTDSQAVRSGLAKYVETWLPNQVKPESRVLIYFAGHGAADAATGEAYLMPWDGDAKYLAATGYPLKELYEKLNALPAREVVVVLDSCFSGAGGRSVAPRGERPLITKIDLGRDNAGRLVVFTAAGSDETTGTAADQGHGLFTYYFLKGLNGAAQGSEQGTTVQQLFDYVAPNVEDAARRENRDQSPRLLVPPSGQRQLLIKDLGAPVASTP